ncbi:MAG: TetR/AcrR family transcriptional regulator [Desulfobacterales bacterium]|nr:TetR/AcrR family transcriptional regulator [Desulfobacterales bacterium]
MAKKSKKKSKPDSYYKILDALEALIEEKNFSEIKWNDLAAKADVNAGLIYRYYKDLKNVLFVLFEKTTLDQVQEVQFGLRGIEGAFNKLRKFIWIQLHDTVAHRARGRMQLLEARAHKSYFDSPAYEASRKYVSLLRGIIEEGIETGEIRDDLPVNDIIRIILGAIEHTMMPALLFNLEAGSDNEIDRQADTICKLLFPGLKKSPL